MKKFFLNKKAFTLIELIVAIAITSLVLVSITEIFLFSSTLTKKVDMSRIMQENVKNITEIIWEDVRINWINNLPNGGNLYNETNTLETWTWWTSYYLAKFSNWSFINANLDCSLYKKEDRCILVREKNWEIEPLVNSWVSFEKLDFYISSWTIDWNKWLAKVTMRFIIRPATWKWIWVEKIKNSKIIWQTTFSQRIYKYK